MATFPDQHPRLRRDPGQVGASLALLPEQLISAWQQVRRVRWPSSIRSCTHVVVTGMGGSHLAADILRTSLAAVLKKPITIIADYQLPAWANRQTLVIATSYSGSTEETLHALKSARRRSPVVVITSGGALATAAKRFRLPAFMYTPDQNPSAQPRLGVGYSLVGTLDVLRHIGAVRVTPAMRQEMVWTARDAGRRFSPATSGPRNVAKTVAMFVGDRIPLLIGAEWVTGNLHTWNNQLHENAKSLSLYDVLPDLNHHLLEGLRNRSQAKQLAPVIIASPLYHPRTQRRVTITAAILTKLGAKPLMIKHQSIQPLNAAIEILALGGYASWYLSILRGVDPAPIPTVNYLKAQLKK